NLRAEKGGCILELDDLLEYRYGMLLALLPPERPDEKTIELLTHLRKANAGNVWLAAAMLYRGHDRHRLEKLKAISHASGAPLLASNQVLYHDPKRRVLQDVVTCIREKTTIEKAGRLLESNAE